MRAIMGDHDPGLRAGVDVDQSVKVGTATMTAAAGVIVGEARIKSAR